MNMVACIEAIAQKEGIDARKAVRFNVEQSVLLVAYAVARLHPIGGNDLMPDPDAEITSDNWIEVLGKLLHERDQKLKRLPEMVSEAFLGTSSATLALNKLEIEATAEALKYVMDCLALTDAGHGMEGNYDPMHLAMIALEDLRTCLSISPGVVHVPRSVREIILQFSTN